MIRWLFAMLVALAAPAVAQVVPDPELTQRANQLPEVIAGKIAYDAYFAQSFRNAVPEAQFRKINAQLTAANGPVTKVDGIAATTPFSGTVKLGYARAVANVQIVVDPAAPHLVTGLRITGAETRDDSIAKLTADFAKLPGKRALMARELGGRAAPLIAIEADTAGAQASGFKLFVLAEAARAVKAGELAWDKIVPLAPDLISSATMSRWPAGMPVTLQSAATAMIATSDNRATDTVMAALDPATLEKTALELGIDRRSLPMLNTQQALAMKTRAQAALADRWAAADEAGRRSLLRDNAAVLAAAPIPVTEFTASPLRIDSIEWFATPAVMAKALDRLRQDGSAPVLDALAVNRGTDPAMAARFAWIGFKGGSEQGVMAMNYLVRTKKGRWFAVTGYWNDPAKPVQDLTFATLMSRALGLIPQD